MNNKIKSFLLKHNAYVSCINDEHFIKDFLLEMNEGLKNKSSLAMEHTFVFDCIKLTNNSKQYILLDAGGTNIRGCIGYIKNKRATFKNIKTSKMFGVDKLINKEDFYNGFYKFIKSITDEELDIGCCFSFTCKMNKNLDGEITYFGKNIKTKGVIGTYFAKELKAKFKKDINISIINDTISTNLGSQYSINKSGNYISIVWGTGINACYYENTSNNKIKELINIETCGFDKFALSDFEKELIRLTDKKDLLEKTSGGVYLASIFNIALNTANKEKLIKLKKKIKLSLKEYSDLLIKNNQILFIDNDSYLTAKQIIIEIIKRAAKLNALALTSIINKINNHKTNYITLEGTTIHKLPFLNKYFTNYIKDFNSQKEIKFLTGSNLNFKGALFVANRD